MTILVQITKNNYLKQKMLTAHLTKHNTRQQGFTLIELLVVIGILAILMGIVLIAINPARQFAQANDTTRQNSVTQILNAVGQYSADNKGQLPAGFPSSPTEVSKAGYDLCQYVSPTYIPSLPVDPKATTTSPVTDCTSSYDTGFQISKDANGRVTVSAPLKEIQASISATR